MCRCTRSARSASCSRRRDRRAASRGDERARRCRDHGAAADARARVRVHQPDRDRSGLRAPPRRRRAFIARSGRSTRAVGGWLGALGPDDLLVLTADHGCDVTMPHTDHTREHVPLLAVFAGHGSRRHDGPLADVGASVLRVARQARAAAELPGAVVRLGPDRRCPSYPRSRRSAASWRRTSRGGTIESVEILDPRWTRPDPAGDGRARADGRARRAGRPRRQVPRSGRCPDDRYLLMHLRMTGALLFDPAAEPPHTRVRFALDGGPPRWPTSIRVGSAPGISLHGAAARDAVPGRAPRRRAVHAGVHRRVPAQRRAGADRAGQGVPARPAPDRRRRQHLRRRGAVPRRHPPAAARRAADRRRSGRACATRSRRRSAPASTPRAPRSTTSATSTARAARSRTASSSTCAPASRARRAGAPMRKIVVGGRGTYVCEHCQPRPRRRRSR